MSNKKPNFIVFLTDDQGYGDLSCMGATDFKTPSLDKLASEGVRFTDWYTNCPVCSTARAALLTGRYPGNTGIRGILPGHRKAKGLPESTPTLAKILKSEGYNTAMVGKWHLGLEKKSRPNSHGFDDWFGFLAGNVDYYSHIYYYGANTKDNILPQVNPTHDLWENEEEVWMDGDYFTEMITDKCIEYLRKMTSEGKPFFLYVPFNAPHYPMHAPKKYMDRFSHLPWDRQVMAAMLSAMDDSVGNIMDELKRLGVDENTLTFFTSDNGPSRETRNWLDSTLDPYYGGTAGKFKGHKGSLFEGGIREPGIMHWPGKIQTGVVSSEPCASMDIAPTILDAAGVNLSDHYLDGKSLIKLANGKDSNSDRVIFWEYLDQTAVRKGKWKLVLKGKLIEAYGPVPEVHLSNLEEDISESINLADKEPEITKELTKLAEDWRNQIEEKWISEYGAPSEEQRLNTQMGIN